MQTQEKTVRELFEQLPEPYRSQAIANTSEENLNMYSRNLLESLMVSFSWINSNEGDKYWSNFYKKLENLMKPKITLEQLPEAVAMLIKEVQEIKNLLAQEKSK